MRLLSALFDAALLPLSVVQDALLWHNAIDGNKSFTRQRIEKIEEELDAR